MEDTADIKQIDQALDLAIEALAPFTPGSIESILKEGGDPLTAADLAVNDALYSSLYSESHGWLSEETVDRTDDRLAKRRTWIVDPIDGTREFIRGIPEWCISVGLVENGEAIAGGIANPATGQRIVGTVGEGVALNGLPVHLPNRTDLRGALVLASRSEVQRGEWTRFFGADISVRNMGSVAYKLALVAVGLADATWTLVPKHEWDVAGGAALVRAAGGEIFNLDGTEPKFNNASPKLDGFIAAAPGMAQGVLGLLGLGSAHRLSSE